MQRVLMTGASGFIGAAVVRELVRQQREVAVLLRPASDIRRLESQLPSLRVIHGDFGDFAQFSEQVHAFRPDAILHLGWQGVKGAERNAPAQIDNVAASVALFRLGQECRVQSFVGMGSQAEYGPTPGRLDESAATRPTTLYGAAKLSTCLLLDRTAEAAGRPFAWLRLFSSYGPGDDPSWLLQYLARTLLSRKRPALTAAQQLWDYIHVDDVARAVVATMDSRAQGIFNLGSGQAHKLKHIVTSLRDIIDPELPLGFGELPYRDDQVMHLEANISRLRSMTGWKPQVPLSQGLQEVVSWLRAQS